MLVGYVGCDSAARLARRGHDLLACSVARGEGGVGEVQSALPGSRVLRRPGRAACLAEGLREQGGDSVEFTGIRGRAEACESLSGRRYLRTAYDHARRFPTAILEAMAAGLPIETTGVARGPQTIWPRGATPSSFRHTTWARCSNAVGSAHCDRGGRLRRQGLRPTGETLHRAGAERVGRSVASHRARAAAGSDGTGWRHTRIGNQPARVPSEIEELAAGRSGRPGAAGRAGGRHRVFAPDA
jgi:hypothetical protein